MKNYILQENETILFRGNATLLPDGKKLDKDIGKSDILLTNLNIVLVSKVKKMFKTVDEIQVYKVSDVKIYDETIQIIRRKSMVDIYLKSGEIFADFEKEKDAKEFCDKALRLISGYSKLVRSVKKTQKAIKETNEALDIDIVEIAKDSALLACEMAVEIGTAGAAGKSTKIASKFAGFVLNKSKNQEKRFLVGEKPTSEDAVESV